MQTSRNESLAGYERWQHAQRRVELLQSAFDRPECMDAAIERGRYLRLCAQIAYASGLAEARRGELLAILEAQNTPEGPA